MIIITAQAVVPPRNLQKMLYDKQTITALAKQIVANQVEAHIDMVCDFSTEYKTFAEVENCIQGAKETAAEYIEDLLNDFREELYSAAREVEIKVRQATFANDGLQDAEVEIL